MRLLVDTNVLVAALVKEGGDGPATRLLDDDHECCVALLSLMEVRTVLTKKKRLEQDEAEQILTGIAARADVYATERDDVLNAYELQKESLLYPVDCLLLSLADGIDAKLVSFDAELQTAGALDPEALA